MHLSLGDLHPLVIILEQDRISSNHDESSLMVLNHDHDHHRSGAGDGGAANRDENTSIVTEFSTPRKRFFQAKEPPNALQQQKTLKKVASVVEDWYKSVLQQMESHLEYIDKQAAHNATTTATAKKFKSCRRTAGLLDEGGEYYSSHAFQATACHNATGTTLVYYNPFDQERILCGKTIPPGGTIESNKICNEPTRLYPVIPDHTKTTGLYGIPPITTRFNDREQRLPVQNFTQCDIPCQYAGSFHITGDRTIDGTDWNIKFSMEGAQEYKQLKVNRLAYKMNRFYSTTSFQSEIPLPYFSYAEYNIQSPAIDYDSIMVQKAALFLARNCNSKSHREEIVQRLQEVSSSSSSSFRIDSLSKCLHNADPPPGVSSLSNKTQLLKSYLFFLAFENQREDDYITEKIWEPLAAGTLPVNFGAPNAKDMVPNRSMIHVDDYDTLEDLVVHLTAVAYNKTLTSHIITCRTCRWAAARKYGMGWDRDTQSIRDLIIPRQVCILGKDEEYGSGGKIVRPFREVWIDSASGQEVVTTTTPHPPPVTDKKMTTNSTTLLSIVPSCVDVNPSNQILYIDGNRLQRTLWQQDGVIDLVIHRDGSDVENVQSQRKNLTLRIDTPLDKSSSTMKHIQDGQICLEDRQSRFTLLTWPKALAREITMRVNEDGQGDGGGGGGGGVAFDVPIRHTDKNNILPLRLRIIVEDIDTFHQAAEKVETYFGGRMVEDFFHPVEAFFIE